MDERSRDVYMFRKVKHNRLVSVDRHQHLVDIHQCEDSTPTLGATGGRGQASRWTQPAVEFIWDDMDISPASMITRLECKLNNVDDSDNLRFSALMMADDFLLCRQFLKMIYCSFGSRVVRFDPRNSWFDIIHEDELTCRGMREKQPEGLMTRRLGEMLARTTEEELKVDVKMPSLSKDEHQTVLAGLKSSLKTYQTSTNIDKDYESLLREQQEINAFLDTMTARLHSPQQPMKHPERSERPKNQPVTVSYDGDILYVNPMCPTKSERQEQLSQEETCRDAFEDIRERTFPLTNKHQNESETELYGGHLQPTEDLMPGPMSYSRGDGMDTVLCLDTSLSMGEDGLREMKDIALRIIDGIDMVASDHDIEENLAVVQFGGPATILHPLTNDYGSVRDAIEKLQLGGMSPLQHALATCLLALKGRGRVCRISNVHQVLPRIIIITDGRASIEDEGDSDVDKADMGAKMNLLRVLGELGNAEHIDMLPKPIVWIPAGKADEALVDVMSKRCNGKLVKGAREILRLSSYQRVQRLTANLYMMAVSTHASGAVSQRENMKSLLSALAPDLDRDDQDEILLATQAKLEGHKGSGNPPPSGNDFDTINEDPQFALPLGARVVRGPDWSWGEQDSRGTGTVINHGRTREPGSVWVEWDNGSYNRYNYGNEGRYDVWEVTDQFRNTSIDMPIQVGCEVTRGPNWTTEYGEQDGGKGCVGVVIRKNKSGLIKVRWKETGFIGCYHYSQTGRKDVAIRDPLECFKSLMPGQDSASSITKERAEEKTEEKTEEGQWVWRVMDDRGRWRDYPAEVNSKLEREYQKRPTGSSLIEGNVRVMFKEMIERNLGTNKHRSVQRIKLRST